jgi:predicted component of type VI protein secretion system
MLTKTQIEMFFESEDYSPERIIELVQTAQQLIEWLEPLVMPQSLYGMDNIDNARQQAREYFLEEW